MKAHYIQFLENLLKLNFQEYYGLSTAHQVAPYEFEKQHYHYRDNEANARLGILALDHLFPHSNTSLLHTRIHSAPQH